MLVDIESYGLGSADSSATTNATYAGIESTAITVGSMFGPIGAAVGALVAAGAAIANAIGLGSGCGPNCVKATQIVNQAEPLLVQNLDAYENGQLSQTDAVNNFLSVKTAVTQACNGIPGQTNCVSDRFTVGGCKWKATSQPYPNSPAQGSCWNWDSGYYQPLLQAPVTPMPTSSDSVVSSITSDPTLLIVGGLLVVGFMLTR